MEPVAKVHDFSANPRPRLDSSSFEKLLAAAWVLQCQKERKPIRLPEASPLPLANVANKEILRPAEKVLPPPITKTATPGAPKFSAYLRRWIESLKRDRFKVRIPPSSRRAAVAACLPSLILAVILAFALSEISRQGHEVAAATQAVDAGGENATLTTLGVRNKEGGNGDLQIAGESKSVTTLPTSHNRITDPETQLVVDDLSRYEIRVLRWQAEGGDDSAALVIGMLYETGHYLPHDCQQAARWVAKAAGWGNAAAEYNLALRYREGDGVPVDEREAEQWLQKAADQKYVQAAEALREVGSHGF